MSHYADFDQEKINAAHEAAKAHYVPLLAESANTDSAYLNLECLKLTGGCVSVTVENGQICLNLPIVGSKCLPVPNWCPNGTAAQACLSICYTWGIPTGVTATVSVAGNQVVSKSFGKC
jgi:hypothetical protein